VAQSKELIGKKISEGWKLTAYTCLPAAVGSRHTASGNLLLKVYKIQLTDFGSGGTDKV